MDLRPPADCQREVALSNIDVAQASAAKFFDKLHQRFARIQIFFARRGGFERVDEFGADVNRKINSLSGRLRPHLDINKHLTG